MPTSPPVFRLFYRADVGISPYTGRRGRRPLHIIFRGTPRVTSHSVGRCPKDREARRLLGGVPYKANVLLLADNIRPRYNDKTNGAM